MVVVDFLGVVKSRKKLSYAIWNVETQWLQVSLFIVHWWSLMIIDVDVHFGDFGWFWCPFPWKSRGPFQQQATVNWYSTWYAPSKFSWKDTITITHLPGLVNIQKTMERSTMFNGKIHYFDWAMFNSYVSLPERSCSQDFSQSRLNPQNYCYC